MNVKPSDLAHRDFYHILISSVAPRPIAWVSTVNSNGRPNLAPFSFFNVISSLPPLLGFSPALRRSESGSSTKDTARNIRDSKEFVVNTVTEELADAMNVSSGEYAEDVNEFEMAGIEMRPSTVVKVPQVAASPVSFECKLYRIIDFGKEAPSGSFIIGEIVSIHVDEKMLKDGKLDGDSMHLIGRMGGSQYAKTDHRFEIKRPSTAK